MTGDEKTRYLGHQLWFSSSEESLYHNIEVLIKDGYTDDKILPVARYVQQKAKRSELSRKKYNKLIQHK